MDTLEIMTLAGSAAQWRRYASPVLDQLRLLLRVERLIDLRSELKEVRHLTRLLFGERHQFYRFSIIQTKLFAPSPSGDHRPFDSSAGGFRD